jgi:hypothetical protein
LLEAPDACWSALQDTADLLCPLQSPDFNLDCSNEQQFSSRLGLVLLIRPGCCVDRFDLRRREAFCSETFEIERHIFCAAAVIMGGLLTFPLDSWRIAKLVISHFNKK